MFILALGFAVVSYLVFGLGLVHHLVLPWLILPLLLWVFFLLWRGSRICQFLRSELVIAARKNPGVTALALGLSALFVGVNGLGLLVPETAFDALWYHLTLPKLYLQSGSLEFFPGGLLYYSAMPQAMEMHYLLGLAFGGQTLARFWHFAFGLLAAAAAYSLARRFLNRSWAFLASLGFYSQLTVAWLSSTAYVDLTRTFFEVLALIAALTYLDERKARWLALSGMLVGIATTVKLLSLGSWLALLVLVLFFAKDRLKSTAVFFLGALVTTLPWFMYGWLVSKTWFYPFFTDWFWQTLTVGQGATQWFLSRTPWAFGQALWRTAFTRGDILTPLILIGLPLVLAKLPVLLQSLKGRFLLAYAGIMFFQWFLTPVNYNRLLLPFTPALITLTLWAAKTQTARIRQVFVTGLLVTTLLHLGARGVLAWQVLEYLRAGHSPQAYLDAYLPASLGNPGGAADFLRRTVKADQTVLVVGGHNLYYVPVAFAHESWAKPGVEYTYIVTVERDLPEKFGKLPVVFEDEDYRVKIYELN